MILVARVMINKNDFNSGVSANIHIVEEKRGMTHITGIVRGLPVHEKLTKYSFYIHEKPFENHDCTTAGSQFNPFKSKNAEQSVIEGNTL